MIDATGPFHGISEIESAIDVAIIPVISGELSGSTERTVITTETSFLISFGKRGLIGLSTHLEARIALSEALPSLFVKEPGILPTAYIFSSKSTESGKKSTPSLGFAEAVTLAITTVSPYLTQQEPLASPQVLPVSTTTGLPAYVVSKVLKFSNIVFPPF